jgi:glutathione peroxidase
MHTLIAILGLAAIAGIVHAAEPATPAKPASPLDFTLKDIDGKDFPLAQLKGKVVLLVNVASKCGLTRQYTALQKLYADNNAKGLVLIGVPANNFGGQEPGSAAEIKTFCSTKYQVTFPLMAKISVKGKDIDPLYAWLTTQSPKPGEIEWNFAKFLIGRDGQVIGRFHPKVTPDDADLLKAVADALAAK